MSPRQSFPAFIFLAAMSQSVHAFGATPKLFSYDANYVLQLARGSVSTGPRAATGMLQYRFSETCDGWQTRSRATVDLTFRDSTTLVNTRDFESYESKDGREYTFAVRTIKGEVPVEAFRGSAKLNDRGAGTVVYEIPNEDPKVDPRKVTITLPKGTLLPVQHNLALLERAAKGDKQFRSVIFNGSSSVGPRAMSTLIGPQLEPVAPPSVVTMPQVDKELLETPAWDLNLAFYNLIERRDTPTFEVFQRYYASGVAPAFEQQFNDFTISAELDRLQRLPTPTCAKSSAPESKKKKR